MAKKLTEVTGLELYIYGAGEFGTEYYGHSLENNQLVNDHNRGTRITILGFLDDNPDIHEVKIGKKRIQCISPQELLKSSNEKPNVAIAIGNPNALKKVSERWSGEFDFPNVTFQPVYGLNESVIMGRGNITTPGCRFTVNSVMGDFNIININSYIAHNVVIGSCNVFDPEVKVNGRVTIGSGNLFGTGAGLRDGIVIGDNSIIGMGAVVVKNVESRVVVVGNPAKFLKSNI